MPLLYPDTQASARSMIDMMAELQKDLREMRGTLAQPPAKVRAHLPLTTAIELMDDVLALTERVAPSSLEREELRGWVNLLYDVSRVSVEYLKTFTEMPQVPRPRAR